MSINPNYTFAGKALVYSARTIHFINGLPNTVAGAALGLADMVVRSIGAMIPGLNVQWPDIGFVSSDVGFHASHIEYRNSVFLSIGAAGRTYGSIVAYNPGTSIDAGLRLDEMTHVIQSGIFGPTYYSSHILGGFVGFIGHRSWHGRWNPLEVHNHDGVVPYPFGPLKE